MVNAKKRGGLPLERTRPCLLVLSRLAPEQSGGGRRRPCIAALKATTLRAGGARYTEKTTGQNRVLRSRTPHPRVDDRECCRLAPQASGVDQVAHARVSAYRRNRRRPDLTPSGEGAPLSSDHRVAPRTRTSGGNTPSFSVRARSAVPPQRVLSRASAKERKARRSEVGAQPRRLGGYFRAFSAP